MSEATSRVCEADLKLEWLATNGLGGYASSSVCGAPLRKYHGLLVSGLPAPYGRTVMLNYVSDCLVLPDQNEIPLSSLQQSQVGIEGNIPLVEFRLDHGLPIWRYEVNGIILEKMIFLIHRQNTLHIRYRLISSPYPLFLKWRPYFNFRTHEQPVNVQIPNESYLVNVKEQQYEVKCEGFPLLRLYNFDHPPFTMDPQKIENVFYEIEFLRGYESVGSLTSPGYYLSSLSSGETITFIASTESWEAIHALNPHEAIFTERMRRRRIIKTADLGQTSNIAKKLVLAADQFIITPTSRFEDMIRLQAAGEEVRTIIAGYPWFTDWGRDTMISLEGLTMITGRFKEAHSILRTFAYYVKDGLIPNMFPDGEKTGLYHTADATLWFFHAVDRYIQYSGDDDILELMLPRFEEIINYHIKGTHFGIKADTDGLLFQGAEGYQLTWMDAKVGDWVVTPRRGKAVEINALWYNALKLFELWKGKSLEISERCYESFNRRFWYEEGQYLYDVVDGANGNDSALRPNQLFAISLRYPVLERQRWNSVLEAVHRDLLTPVGLRTLSPSHPDFKSTYDGDLRARDAAYHQGTVWPWLLGPFIDVWLKVHPEEIQKARGFLQGVEKLLNPNDVGTLGEIFDASEPFHARGCFAQAWSVAEILRVLKKLYSLSH